MNRGTRARARAGVGRNGPVRARRGRAPGPGPAAGRAAPPAADQPVGRSAPAGPSSGVRSGRPTWAAASTTSRWSRATRRTIYVGFATGGVWKTTNNGTTCHADLRPATRSRRSATSRSRRRIPTSSTSAPAKPTTGRARRSATASTSRPTRGKTFEVRSASRTRRASPAIVVHPKDPNIVYVAAVGHLFGPNHERGLYKTTDGGKTWTNTKFIDDDTGFTDVVMDPSNPERPLSPRRTSGGGRRGASTAAAPGSGIWKTTDAGKTWTKLHRQRPARQSDDRTHRPRHRAIASPTTIYASIEVGPSGGTGAGVNDDGTLVAGRGAAAAAVAAAAAQRASPPPDPNKSGIWRSDDGGKTWRFLSNQGDRPMYYSQIRVDPTNPEIAYQGGAPFFKTVDGGKTWRQVQGIAHSDHHAIWIDPTNGNHLMVGNDGGLDVSYDQAETLGVREHDRPVGQFYAVSADMRKPYFVCGGLQDNGSWCGPSAMRSQQRHPELGLVPRRRRRRFLHRRTIRPTGRILYSESQDGATSRLDLRPRHDHQHPAARPGRPRRARPARRRATRVRDPDGAAAQFGVRPAARPTATSCRRRRRTRASASTGTRRSCCRRTIRDDLSRRRPAVQVVRPRRHVGGVGRSDEEHRPQRSADHGRGRQGADGLEARRRGRLQQHHDASASRRSCPASSGPAPTTATCR